MTTYTAFYLTIATVLHGQDENVTPSASNEKLLYFTRLANILYTFGGHSVTVRVISFGYTCSPLYLEWDKAIGMHATNNIWVGALARLLVVILIWFFVIIFSFYDPINLADVAFLSIMVYIIPCLTHMLTFRTFEAREVIKYKLFIYS